MHEELIVASDRGVLFAHEEAGVWQVTARQLENRPVTAVTAYGGAILAGTRDGIFRAEASGRPFEPAGEGLSQPHVRWLDYHANGGGRFFAGTEPAGLFVTEDGGQTWRGRPEVEALRDVHEWFLPYSPQAGCVRGFAFHGQRAYAAVEVGGLLRSDDGGQGWRLADGSDGVPRFGDPAPGRVHPDVHSVTGHPSSADLIFAPTGGGFYASADGGQTWARRYPSCYCRAVWVDPADPAHLVLGPADSVDRGGRIEESPDGGRSWRRVDDGLGAPWRGHMVERFTPVGGRLFAVLSNGELLVAAIGEGRWQRALPDAPPIRAIAALA
jgi:photosystem II stability/assembly factor-like uncharacterized protein